MKQDPQRGEISEGDARYLLIRHDSLMGLFRQLPAPARGEALQAFADSLAEHGGRSAARYDAEDHDRLLATIPRKAGELGWGVWTLQRNGDALELKVENSPFAQGYGAADAPVCAPITGMLRAVAALVLGGAAVSREDACAAAGAAVCRFSARRKA